MSFFYNPNAGDPEGERNTANWLRDAERTAAVQSARDAKELQEIKKAEAQRRRDEDRAVAELLKHHPEAFLE